jgi:hypothetical protein
LSGTDTLELFRRSFKEKEKKLFKAKAGGLILLKETIVSIVQF